MLVRECVRVCVCLCVCACVCLLVLSTAINPQDCRSVSPLDLFISRYAEYLGVWQHHHPSVATEESSPTGWLVSNTLRQLEQTFLSSAGCRSECEVSLCRYIYTFASPMGAQITFVLVKYREGNNRWEHKPPGPRSLRSTGKKNK